MFLAQLSGVLATCWKLVNIQQMWMSLMLLMILEVAATQLPQRRLMGMLTIKIVGGYFFLKLVGGYYDICDL